jgi:hypothetical protein
MNVSRQGFEGLEIEAAAVERVFGPEPEDTVGIVALGGFGGLVRVTGQFSRPPLAGGELPAIISDDRIGAIPAITARHVKMVAPARSDLSTDDVLMSWRQNMPKPYGRHPNRLFDLAQRNFGTDAPTDGVIASIDRAARQRELLTHVYGGLVGELGLNTEGRGELTGLLVDETMKQQPGPYFL